MKKYEKLAKEILKLVGGSSNVENLTHCITRLRFNLVDFSKANTEEISKLDGVLTVVQKMGQYQVVIGNHVGDVYEEIIPFLENNKEKENVEKKGIFDTLVNALSKIFQPMIGTLAGVGLLKGVAAILLVLGFSKTSGLYLIFQTAGDAFFQFIPIIIAYTTANYLNSNKFIAMGIASALVYPNLGSNMQLFTELNIGILKLSLPKGGYASTVMPIIFAILLASYIEKYLRKITPDNIKLFAVPFFTIILSFTATLLAVGPIINTLSEMLGNLIQYLFTLSGFLTAGIISGTWMILVMFGLHWSIIPLMINNIATLGQDKLGAAFHAHSLVLAGVLFAIYIKTKEKKVKEISMPSGISAIFGITEPGIYGVALPMKKPFIIACIISGLVGAFAGYFDLTSHSTGALGIFALFRFISPNGIDFNFYVAVIEFILAIVLGFVVTLFIDIPLLYEKEEKKEEIVESNKINILAPIKGKILEIEKVEDKVFSSKQLGDGLAIIPEEGKVYAPFDGYVSMLFPTLHAISLESKDGVEILIHIGIDTVKLGGEHFKSYVKTGDIVKQGDLLLEFDIEKIKEKGYVLETPIILTNSVNYLDIVKTDKENIENKDDIMVLLK